MTSQAGKLTILGDALAALTPALGEKSPPGSPVHDWETADA